MNGNRGISRHLYRRGGAAWLSLGGSIVEEVIFERGPGASSGTAASLAIDDASVDIDVSKAGHVDNGRSWGSPLKL